MFQAKISPILTLWYKAPTMLPAGDQDEVELVITSSTSSWSPAGSILGGTGCSTSS